MFLGAPSNEGKSVVEAMSISNVSRPHSSTGLSLAGAAESAPGEGSRLRLQVNSMIENEQVLKIQL